MLLTFIVIIELLAFVLLTYNDTLSAYFMSYSGALFYKWLPPRTVIFRR